MSLVRTPLLLLAAALVIAGCGSSGPVSGDTTITTAAESTGSTTSSQASPTTAASAAPTTAAPPAAPTPGRGGSATLTVGDQTWEFQTVICAFGEAQTGQEGAEFILSAIEDGMQLYATIDSWGHRVSLDDIEDFENPSVSLQASDASFGGQAGNAEFIEVSGKSVRAAAVFADMSGDGFDESPGTLVGTCP